MEQVKYFESNPELLNQSRVYMDIPYVVRDGREYKMQIVLPWAAEKGKKYPGLLFVQGSAWTTSDVGWEIPQLPPFSIEAPWTDTRIRLFSRM